MFKEQQISAYQGIHAPQELYDKVMAAKKPARHWGRIATGLAAACLVLVVSGTVFFRGGSPDIRINGQQLESSVVFYDAAPAMELRSVPMIAVPVELELPKDATITVTHGVLAGESGEAASQWEGSGKVSLLWQIPRGQELTDCQLQIRSGRDTTVLSLEYEESKITITKKGD